MRLVVRTLLALLILSTTGLCAADLRCNADRQVLARHVPSFRIESLSPVEAILALGQQERICFGLRNLSKRSFLKPTTASFQNRTVLQIVRALLNDEHNLRVVNTGKGTIYVFVPSGSRNLLDYKFKRFFIPSEKTGMSDAQGRMTLLTASEVLSIWLRNALQRSPQGLVGSFSPGNAEDMVGPFDETNITVEQLLNLMVGQSTGASWIAALPDDKARRNPARWRIFEYDRPIEQYRREIGKMAEAMD